MSETDVDVLEQAFAWTKAGAKVALATVVETWGSAPRKAGAHMAIREDGLFFGSVSGGCIEGAVIQAGIEISDDTGCLLDFGISNESAWEVGLACGGKITVWLEIIHASMLASIIETHRRRKACAIVMSPNPDHSTSLVYDWKGSSTAKSLIQPDDSFLRIYKPQRRIFAVGAVHIAQSLVLMAEQVGYEVVVIDPRGIFLHSERWGGVNRVDEYPDEYFATEELGEQDAVITLSHDPKFDDPALASALRSPAFYIGALGSRSTHASRCVRLKALGFDSSDIERIHGPVGLSISASTPAEIAVSILAEVISHQRRQ